MVLGGRDFGAGDERALKVLARGVAPALENMDEAPGGMDQLSGLPNRASLLRVLRREVSYGGGGSGPGPWLLRVLGLTQVFLSPAGGGPSSPGGGGGSGGGAGP